MTKGRLMAAMKVDMLGNNLAEKLAAETVALSVDKSVDHWVAA